jgi:hypothetical protein
MRAPPDATWNHAANGVRDSDCSEQFGTDDPEADGEGPVTRRERHEHLAEGDRNDPVKEERASVQHEKDARDDREEAV